MSTLLHHDGKSPDSVLDKSKGAQASWPVVLIVSEKTGRGGLSHVLFHRSRSLVSALRDDRILDRLALLVFHRQRLVRRGVNQFHFDLAERSIVLGVARLVR